MQVYLYWSDGRGWLIDRDGYWIWRFHLDEKAWIRDPKVFVDRGRQVPDAPPSLLKERRYLRKEDAERFWKELQGQGGSDSVSRPGGGAAVEV